MPKLTDRFLAALSVNKDRKDRLVFDTVSPGLGVRVTAKGTRTFIVQWTDPVTKRKVREPLGIWGSLSIDQAREAAKVRLGQVAKGINPRAERLRLKAEDDRERAEAALSFEALVDEWGQLHLAHRRKRYREEAQRAIKHTFADLLKRPAARIARADIINVLDKLVRSAKAVTAARSLAYARAAFNWAAKREKVPHNPFVGLPVATVTAERERVLTDAEVADLWAAIETMGYPWGPFFCLAILTLQRREEVAAMRWSEIAPDLSVWTMSGARMKNGKPHDVHLSGPARAVLRTLSEARGKDNGGGKGEICDFVFSTTGKTSISGFSRAKARLDAAIAEARAAALPRSPPRSSLGACTTCGGLAPRRSRGWASTRSPSISSSPTSRQSSGVSPPSTSVTISPRSGRGPWTCGPNTCSPTTPDSASDRWTPRCSSSSARIGRLLGNRRRNS
jgi:integrase